MQQSILNLLYLQHPDATTAAALRRPRRWEADLSEHPLHPAFPSAKSLAGVLSCPIFIPRGNCKALVLVLRVQCALTLHLFT